MKVRICEYPVTICFQERGVEFTSGKFYPARIIKNSTTISLGIRTDMPVFNNDYQLNILVIIERHKKLIYLAISKLDN